MRRTLALVLALSLLALAAPALSHDERETTFPSGDGKVPRYRTKGPYLVVCKGDSLTRSQDFPADLKKLNKRLFKECKSDGFKHIQKAVNAVAKPKTRIFVLPGVYEEQPSLAPQKGACATLEAKIADDGGNLEYGEHRKCPHLQNLITILGDGSDKGNSCDNQLCGLQIEGTGAAPEDVIIEGNFNKLNVVRADRADGVYFRNFTVQHSSFNGIYVIETDGFGIDNVVGRWGDEYGFLTFTVDHGLVKNCEAYGNGDAGVYPGSAAPHFGDRYSVEIRNCDLHHNLLGYSGTAGNSVYAHDNSFHHNGAGISMDSLFPDHPGLPQGYSTFENNSIYSNNQDYYQYYRDGTCDLPSSERGYEEGVVCPSVGIPVGTGILLAGGNSNTFTGNQIYDNWRYGTMQFWVPAYFRGESDPELADDTSHNNHYVNNLLGIPPDDTYLPNGLDFWWDEQGEGNCWDGNVEGMEQILSDPEILPDCDPPPPFTDVNLSKQTMLLTCSYWSKSNNDPANCDWYRTPEPPSRGQTEG
jgi:hypothetical protein